MKLNTGIQLAAALCALALAPTTQAATDVYSQAQNGTLIAKSAVYNVGAADPGFTWSLDQDEEIWAYFSLPANASFNRISWYGSKTDGNFGVDLFAASCFSCGVNLVQTDGTFSSNLLPGGGPYTPAQVHMTPVAGSIYSYYIDLPSTVTLSASSAYAISVVNNYVSSPFLWAGSGTGSGTHLQYVVGQAMFLPGPGNLAFTLTNTAPVPEPAAFWMLALGLGVVWGRSRKAGARHAHS